MDPIDVFVQGSIVLLFLYLGVQWLRRGGPQRRDITLAFAPLAAILVAGWFPDGLSGPWRVVLIGAFVLQPLLFLNLVRHLHRVPASLYVIGGGLALAGIALLGTDRGGALVLGVVGAAMLLPYLASGYYLFDGALKTRGVGRHRLLWAGIAAVVFATLLTGLIVSSSWFDSSLGRSNQVALVFSFLWAFAPPARVRRAWRAVEFQRFAEATRSDPDESLPDRLERIRAAAQRVVEADATFILEQREDQTVVCVAEAEPFPLDDVEARQVVAAAHGGSGMPGWAAVALRAPGQPDRALAVRAGRSRLFPEEDDAMLEVIAQEVEGRFLEAAYRSAQEDARQAAEGVARFRSEYLRAVGHEIANPLSPIKLQVRILQARHGEESAKPLAIIERNVGRIEAMLRDVATIARLSTAAIQLDVDDIDLGDLAHRLAEAHDVPAREQGATLTVDAEAGCIIAGDALRIEQILDNLVSNAIKYSPGGGEIQVRVRRDGPQATIEVQDQGLGLDGDQMRRLFDRYERVHTQAEPLIQGTGMGLYIARQLARLHGGDVTARSDGSGEGSAFTVTLPVLGPQGDGAEIERPPLPGVRIADEP